MSITQLGTMPDGSPITVETGNFKRGDMVIIGKVHTSRGSLVHQLLRKYEGKVGTIEEVLKTKHCKYCVRPLGANGTLRLNDEDMKIFVNPAQELDMDPEREAMEAFEQHREDTRHPDEP